MRVEDWERSLVDVTEAAAEELRWGRPKRIALEAGAAEMGPVRLARYSAQMAAK